MIPRQRLFLASCLALVVTAMTFAIRGDIMVALGDTFTLSNEQLGLIAGTAFWGFTLAMIVGGPLCDSLGMRPLIWIAFVGHVAGIVVTILAGATPSPFTTLFLGTLLIGLGNGFIEAACNPLVATLYPDRKAEKLNQFHVWFPGGIVIGGLVAFLLTQLDGGWQVKMAAMLLPAFVYGYLFLGQPMPKTERVAAGISTGAMWQACVRPLFLLMVFCMFLTAATELATNQWIPAILTESAGVAGILVLVWINGLMAVGRQFAGPVIHRLSPTGVLVFSAVFSLLGLWGMSAATGWMTFAAATVFAVGICYFWPTMLGFVSERVPESGALGLAVMGGAGMLSTSIVLPILGGILDGAPLAEGGPQALRLMMVLPAVLIVIFAVLYLRDRAQGGYRAVRIGSAPTDSAL